MAKVSTHINFVNQTEEAFDYYRGVFGTDYAGPIARYGDIPAGEETPPMDEATKQLVMNVQLPILGGHLLMGSDVPPFMGSDLQPGNKFTIALHPDSRAEADALFAKLADGGAVEMPMADAFWGDYFGMLTDRYGVQWMIDYAPDRG